MRLGVYANGHRSGKGTHISVYVYLMKGEFDNFLKWPFRGEVVIQLKKSEPPHFRRVYRLRDDTPDECAGKPTEEMNESGRGFSQYISHDELYAGRYLKNNQLHFCVSDIYCS